MTHPTTTHIRVDIEGLRGIAVLAVLLGHMNASWMPGGYLGVDVFFVISGFVVTQMILRARDKEPKAFSLRTFYAQRFWRIAPAYFVLVAVAGFVTALLFLPADFSEFESSWHHALLFNSNSYFASYGDYFSPSLAQQPLLHTWSLAVEMKFYFFLPLLLLAFKSHHMSRLVIWGITALAWAAVAAWVVLGPAAVGGLSAQQLYYALALRSGELLLGASLVFLPATWSTHRRGVRVAGWLGWLGCGLLGFAFWGAAGANFSPLHWVPAALGSALIIATHGASPRLTGMLSTRTLVGIGAASYSLYLWHWPILAWIRYFQPEFEWQLWSVAAYGLACTTLTWLSWRWVELPFKGLSSRVSPSRAWGAMGIVFTASLLPIAASASINSWPAQPDQAEQRYADPARICHGKRVGDCSYGADRATRWLVIGDSHAAQLNLAFEAAAPDLNAHVTLLSASSCVPIVGFNIGKLPTWAQDDCRAQVAYVQSLLDQYDRVVLAGMWSYQTQDPSFLPALVSFIHDQDPHANQVTVLAQLPQFIINPLRSARLAQFGIVTTPHKRTEWVKANAQVNAAVQSLPNARFVNLADDPLFRTAPFWDGQLMYHDDHHLNERGSLAYGSILIKALGAPANATTLTH